uniref:Uncharacterized protein n=1 Tax=Taeniopygia guttata TaxID=59729 RepID=A0A674GG29_TAEGU
MAASVTSALNNQVYNVLEYRQTEEVFPHNLEKKNINALSVQGCFWLGSTASSLVSAIWSTNYSFPLGSLCYFRITVIEQRPLLSSKSGC